MRFKTIVILHIIIALTNADIQLTQYAVMEDYRTHDCWQLLPCGPLQRLEVRGRIECAKLAVKIEADMFMYEERNKSCLLCLDRTLLDGFIEVHASLLVYVKGQEIFQTVNVYWNNCNYNQFSKDKTKFCYSKMMVWSDSVFHFLSLILANYSDQCNLSYTSSSVLCILCCVRDAYDPNFSPLLTMVSQSLMQENMIISTQCHLVIYLIF